MFVCCVEYLQAAEKKPVGDSILRAIESYKFEFLHRHLSMGYFMSELSFDKKNLFFLISKSMVITDVLSVVIMFLYLHLH